MSIKSRLKKIKILNDYVTKRKWGERKVCYGKENPDKTFFVIRRNSADAGLFSYVTFHLGWMQYALEKGYIPVVDMCNTKNTYLTKEEVGKYNAWEYYFEQPCGYTLEDIRSSKNVILGSIESAPRYPGHAMANHLEEYRYWKEFAQKYLILKEVHCKELESLYEQMFQGRRVLGVLCRGTDYRNLKPSGHPVQPEIPDMIEKVKEVFEKYQCDYIYLATEDEEILNAFKAEYDEKLKFHDTVRYRDTGDGNINLISEKNADKTPKDRGLDYLFEIGILSKCNCLVAGSVGGTYGAMLLDEEYEYWYIYDLGMYP